MKYLLEMTLRWSSCLSKVAKAHKPPYTAALLGDKSCTKTQGQWSASWAYSDLSPAKQTVSEDHVSRRVTALHSFLFILPSLCRFYTPLDNHSGQKKPAGSTWQLVYISERPALPDLKPTRLDLCGCSFYPLHHHNSAYHHLTCGTL